MKITTLSVGALGTNCHIIENDGRAIIVDPGDEAGRIRRALGKNALAAILLTHGHADHIAAVDALRDPGGVKVYIHRADALMLTDSARNLSAFIGAPLTQRAADVLLAGGEELALAGMTVKVVHTPGHTPGGLAFDLDGKVLLAGDTLFRESIGRTDFPGGDMATLAASVRRLYALGEREVYCGHGPATTLAHEQVHNAFVPL